MSLHTSSGKTGVVKTPSANPTPEAQQGGRLINAPILPGQVYRAVARGTQAYLVTATNSVNMRPEGGDFVQYSQGTGINTVKPFNIVEIQNFNSVPVVISIWIGFDSFIDNRLIITTASNPNIVFPTYSDPLSADYVNIVDLTGGAFEDGNGNTWLALYRIAILIFNLDAGDTFFLRTFSPTGATTGLPVAAVPPAPLPLRLDFSGNYTYNTGGGPVNAIISEIYSAIPATTP